MFAVKGRSAWKLEGYCRNVRLEDASFSWDCAAEKSKVKREVRTAGTRKKGREEFMGKKGFRVIDEAYGPGMPCLSSDGSFLIGNNELPGQGTILLL